MPIPESSLRLALLAPFAAVALAACTTESLDQATSTANTAALAALPAESADADLLALVNDYRAAQGRAPLVATAALDAAALAHARDMTQNGFFSHTGSGGSTVGQRARAAGCSWNAVAENIAKGQTAPSSAMTTWINSPGHRTNILGPYTQFGEARVGNTWVTVFATGC